MQAGHSQEHACSRSVNVIRLQLCTGGRADHYSTFYTAMVFITLSLSLYLPHSCIAKLTSWTWKSWSVSVSGIFSAYSGLFSRPKAFRKPAILSQSVSFLLLCCCFCCRRLWFCCRDVIVPASSVRYIETYTPTLGCRKHIRHTHTHARIPRLLTATMRLVVALHMRIGLLKMRTRLSYGISHKSISRHCMVRLYSKNAKKESW